MEIELLDNFIAFEGLDGSGTTTQSKLVSQAISDAWWTFEPTDNHIGSLVREVLKKEKTTSPLTLAYLFAADRAEHLYNVEGIIHRCNNGQPVVTDRYLFSSLAYQSLSVPFEKVFEMNRSFPVPKIIFFLNVTPEECSRRIKERQQEKELFEEMELQERILTNYMKSFEWYSDRGANIIFLDGTHTLEELLTEELAIIKQVMRIG
jgi:dTMP kinase